MKTKIKEISPANATFDQICQMNRDRQDVGDFTIMTDSYTVWLSEQKLGEPQKQSIAIPPKVFRRLLQWYQKPQPLRAKMPSSPREE